MDLKKYFKKFGIIFISLLISFIIILYIILYLTSYNNWCGAIGGSCDPVNPPFSYYMENFLTIFIGSIGISLVASIAVTFVFYFIDKKKLKRKIK